MITDKETAKGLSERPELNIHKQHAEGQKRARDKVVDDTWKRIALDAAVKLANDGGVRQFYTDTTDTHPLDAHALDTHCFMVLLRSIHGFLADD